MDTEQSKTRRAVSAAVIGNVLEWYDFAVYAYVAVYIAKNFFPQGDPTTGLLEIHAVHGLLAYAVFPLFPRPGDGCIQGYAINPRRDSSIPPKVGDRSPYLRGDFLEQILLIVRSERIRAHHFEEKSPVALEPLVEQPLLVIILHRIRFAILLVANSDRILTTGEAVAEQFQFSVGAFQCGRRSD